PLTTLHPTRSTLFPYTTLFRSQRIRLATDGDLLQVDSSGLTTLGRIPVGRNFGRRESEAYVSEAALGERRKLEEGVVFAAIALRSEEHTSELQSRGHLVCRLLL